MERPGIGAGRAVGLARPIILSCSGLFLAACSPPVASSEHNTAVVGITKHRAVFQKTE